MLKVWNAMKRNQDTQLEVSIYQIADDGIPEEPYRRDGVGLVLGRLAARLDGRHAAAGLPIAACR